MQRARPALLSLALAAACTTEATPPDGAAPGATAGNAGSGTVGGSANGGSSGAAGSTTAGGSSNAAGSANSGSSGAAGSTTAGGSSDAAGSANGGGTAPLGGSAGSGGAAGVGGASSFVLASPAFDNVPGCSVETSSVCDTFPDANVSYMSNANLSPELHWTGAPPGTKSFAVVLFDATFGQAHWAIWNIPADATSLAANVPQDTATPATPPGSHQANANFATTSADGYFGPHIPCNVFELQLYALSVSPFTPQAPESAVLVSIELQDLGASVLGVAKLSARSNDYGTTCN